MLACVVCACMVCVGVRPWITVGVPVCHSVCVCPCSVIVFCMSGTVHLCHWVLWVCLCLWHSGSAYICLCVSLCLSLYVSPSTQVSTRYSLPRPQVGVSGPVVPELGPTPSHPPWARPDACLQCLPQVNTKIRNPRATSLTSALPLSLPWTGLDQTASASKLEMCPAPPPPLVTGLPSPSPSPVLSLSVCSCVSAGLSVPLVPSSSHLDFSRSAFL